MWVAGRLELNDPPIAESGVNNEGAAETKADLTTKARRHEYDWEKSKTKPLFLFRVFVSSWLKFFSSN